MSANKSVLSKPGGRAYPRAGESNRSRESRAVGVSTDRRAFLRATGCGLASLAAACGPAAPGWAARARPNIIFILADDMGFGDPHCNNPDSAIPTPNLDRLAREGMRFTDAHTPSAVCTPTRYGVVTGRYCWRTDMKRGVLNGYSPHLIDTGRLTVAGLLKQNGYHTAVVGKWHLGVDWVFASKEDKRVDYAKEARNTPNALGFDYSYLIPASLDMPPYVYLRNGRVVEAPTDSEPARNFPFFVRAGGRAPGFRFEDCLDNLLGQVTDYIAERAKSEPPFFLYFPLTAPHKPVLPHPRFRGKTALGPYGDFIVQVDWTVGQVLEALDQHGVAGDTLIIFTSDNGSFMYRLNETGVQDHVDDETIQAFRAGRHRANHVFRGTKADIWEGGHHVPFLARWPGRVKPGSECDATLCLTDLMATCADIAGADLPRGAAEDSFSFLPWMLGKRPATPRAPVIHHSAAGMFAIRDGRWKLVLGNGSGGREKPSGKPFEKPYALFDMTKDISERENLAKEKPEIVERLTKRFKEIHDSGRSRGMDGA